MKGWPYTKFPTGWFMIGFSTDLAPGDVKPIEYLGEELVMYRTEDGAVNVIDAYCPHLGAHPDGQHCYGEMRVNPQLPIENAADPMHFAFVHGSDRPAQHDLFETKDEY